MNIFVCVGSSCHLKGSYTIINLVKESIKKHNLSEKVHLSASFCLGKCTEGVTIKIDEQVICGVSIDNFQQIFINHVLNQIEQ